MAIHTALRHCLLYSCTVWLLGGAPAAGGAADSLRGSFREVIESLNFKNTDIKDIARLLAQRYRINLMVDDNVNQRLTLNLVNVTVADALQFMVEDNGLRLKRFGDIYKILPPEEPLPPPKIWRISYEDGLLSVDFRNDDVQDALDEIARRSGETILCERDVSGMLRGIITRLPLEEGLGQLLQMNGFQLRKTTGAYQVHPLYPAGGSGPGRENRPLWVEIRGQKVWMEAAAAPLSRVLGELSRRSGVSIVLFGEPKGSVNLRVEDLELDACLELLLLDSGLSYKKSDGIYWVGDKNSPEMRVSRLFRLRHLKAEGIIEMLPQPLTGRSELKIVKSHNALLVNGSADVIGEIEEVLRSLDRPIPQIFFEALVVDYQSSDIRDISLELGTGPGIPGDSTQTSSGDITRWIPGLDVLRRGKDVGNFLSRVGEKLPGVNIGRLPDDFYLRVKALETAGKANIRSRPQIATLNGHTAELKIGETRYFRLVSETPIRDPAQLYVQTSERFQTVEINISLTITPWVSASGEITVEIEPVFNTPGEQVSANLPPNIQSRSLKSTVRLRDGETIVLGGLIQESVSESISRLPLLGRIPLLGRLFQTRNHQKINSELLIYVTPHLFYGDDWLEPD